MHHTKTKGDLGVLKAQVDLFEQGYMILLPQTEHAPFDLCIYKEGQFKRVQVKYRAVDSRGSVTIHFRSSWADRHGIHENSVNKEEIDIYCIYVPQMDRCYYFDPKRFNRSVTLRVEAPRNNQKAGVKLLEDYRRVP
ncbi:group I intron-associated PD-(D/E)XK endonuclease [Hydrogenimonas urashimensis]|uniref:group I intron-associated PD-(D/E)XK endonuclease n=1 Tax=Hydrogenimonas urashimensis TaxID=2740515 RepID=UPI001915D531|nr:group I intron-associated PD-(D/E)XK endonuclease [Hydrogenimonas urashimensis]